MYFIIIMNFFENDVLKKHDLLITKNSSSLIVIKKDLKRKSHFFMNIIYCIDY